MFPGLNVRIDINKSLAAVLGYHKLILRYFT